jgi:phospholipid/cholesterol/gamma-HCH transport system substrate-binding protein
MANNGQPTVVSTTTTDKNKLKFTALFAKNFYDFTIKGGLIESSGGFGLDYFLLDRNLRFSVEAFNFIQLDIRAFARYNFMKNFYITGGVEDLLNQQKEFTTFLGAGLFITNDDLKVLATRLSL